MNLGAARLAARLLILSVILVWLQKPAPLELDLHQLGFRPESGRAYTAKLEIPARFPYLVRTDSNEHRSASRLRLFQKDRELGPAHSPHAEIRDLGLGRFSHKGNTLYFSTRDGGPAATSQFKAIVPYDLPPWITLAFPLALITELVIWILLQPPDGRVRQALNLDTALWTSNFALTALVIFLFQDTIAFAPMGSDTGCYLALAERFNDGWMPYVDIRPPYSPLGIALMAAARALFGGIFATYPVYLASVLLAQLLTGAAVYWVAGHLATRRALRYLAAVMTVIGTHSHGGNLIILEPFVTFFFVLAAGFFLKGQRSSILAAGALTGTAFLSKQYGALGVFPFVAVIVFSKVPLREKFLRLAIVSGGFFAPLLLMFGFFGVFYAVSPVAILKTFWTPGYVKEVADLGRLYEFCVYVAPYMLITPLFLFDRETRRSPAWWTVLLASLFFAAPLLVRSFQHYFILAIPTVILLGTYMIARLEKLESRYIRWTSPLLVLGFVPMLWSSVERPLSAAEPDARQAQFEVARMLNEIWPPRTSIVVFGAPWIIYGAEVLPAKFPPAMMDYTFLKNFSGEQLAEVVRDNDRIFIDLESGGHFLLPKGRLEERFGALDSFLRANGYCLKAVRQERYQFWERGCSEDTTSEISRPLYSARASGLTHSQHSMAELN